MKEVKKGRFKFQEEWVFPLEVEGFLQTKMEKYGGKWLHCFCGDSKIGDTRVDIDPAHNPDIVSDVLQLPNMLKDSQYNIIADPPWQIKYQDRRNFMYALRDVCKKGGFLIINCPWSPWVKGLSIVEIWKVSQAFNSYRDLVDIWVMKKK